MYLLCPWGWPGSPWHPSLTVGVWSPSCPSARLSWLLCVYLVLGCHPELLRAGVQRSLSDVQHPWGENTYTAPCKALRVYFISCFPSYLPFQTFLWTWILPLICLKETRVHYSWILLLTPCCSRRLSSGGRSSRYLEEDAMPHQQHSIHQECCGSEAKQSVLSSSHLTWGLLCARDTKKLPMVATGAALLVAKVVWWGFHLFVLFLGKVLKLNLLSLKSPHKNEVSLRRETGGCAFWIAYINN